MWGKPLTQTGRIVSLLTIPDVMARIKLLHPTVTDCPLSKGQWTREAQLLTCATAEVSEDACGNFQYTSRRAIRRFLI
jgi:hypothetical protein